MMEPIPLRPGPGFDLHQFFLYYVNRVVPLFTMRRMVADRVARAIGRGAATRDLPADVKARIAELKCDGCSTLRPLLGAAELAEVKEYLAAQDVVTNDGRTVPASQIPHDVRMASYPLRTILECPHLLEAISRPDILALAREYLGCEPTLSSLRIDWSFHCGVGSQPDVQRFHRDYDDWRFFKLFVYLTDVTDRNGPHEFVRGSHTSSGRVFATPFEIDWIRKTYGQNSIVRMLGPTGTTFLVDTWGIHRGSVPEDGRRLMFQAQYSLLPVYKFKYRPQRMTRAAGLPSYTTRLLLS
jgi:Phytanoyl-CoA dioxygenase (PhyH)